MTGAFDVCRGCRYCEHHLSQWRQRVANSRAMRRITLLLLAAASLLVLVRTPPADAQTAAQKAALQKKLLSAKVLKCKFSTVSTGDWEGDKTKAAVAPSKLEIAFSSIDVDEGTAEADGGYGNAFIVVKYAQGYLHFVQISDAGPLYVTTVLAVETTPGHFKAMHTRHEFTPTRMEGFTSRPELYVGECTPSS